MCFTFGILGNLFKYVYAPCEYHGTLFVALVDDVLRDYLFNHFRSLIVPLIYYELGDWLLSWRLIVPLTYYKLGD